MDRLDAFYLMALIAALVLIVGLYSENKSLKRENASLIISMDFHKEMILRLDRKCRALESELCEDTAPRNDVKLG